MICPHFGKDIVVEAQNVALVPPLPHAPTRTDLYWLIDARLRYLDRCGCPYTITDWTWEISKKIADPKWRRSK
jgi:hypothetical protein